MQHQLNPNYFMMQQMAAAQAAAANNNNNNSSSSSIPTPHQSSLLNFNPLATPQQPPPNFNFTPPQFTNTPTSMQMSTPNLMNQHQQMMMPDMASMFAAGTAQRGQPPMGITFPFPNVPYQMPQMGGTNPMFKRPEFQPQKSTIKKKKMTEKVLPKKVETYLPESKLFTELAEFEKKLDASILSKRLDLSESLSRPRRVKRTLRIFLSNLASDQFIPEQADNFELEKTPPPSWTLRIEGRILEPGQTKKSTPVQPKFSTFIKSLHIELQRDPLLFPEGNVIDYYPTASQSEFDGIEIKRKGDQDVHATIQLYLKTNPEKFKLSPELAKLLDIHSDTKENLLMAIWQYVKANKLQDPEDKRKINCDETMEKIFGTASLKFIDIPSHFAKLLLPADPVVMAYTIKVDKEYNVSQYVFDIDVDVDDYLKERMNTAMKEVPNINQIVELDEKINGLIQQITISKMKRDFMKAFADDPVGFINTWIASQSRDLEGLMGENQVNREEMRRSEFYNQQWVREAVFHYLNTR